MRKMLPAVLMALLLYVPVEAIPPEGGGSATPVGTSGQVQVNNGSGGLGASTVTADGSGNLIVPGTVGIGTTNPGTLEGDGSGGIVNGGGPISGAIDTTAAAGYESGDLMQFGWDGDNNHWLYKINSAKNFMRWNGAAWIAVNAFDPTFNFWAPASGDYQFKHCKVTTTISSVSCLVTDGTSVVMDVQKCDANAANCTTILSGTITCGTTDTAGTVSDTTIAAGHTIKAVAGTVTGTTKDCIVKIGGTQ